MNEQLDRIEKMLRAQLRSAGHVWWIGGYVYGQTSRDDLFIILYPADEKLNEKVVRVYPHDFKKLPSFIQTEGIDGGDTDANPGKDVARRKGIYHECPLFEIVTVDGKETQMGRERRFGDVLRVSRSGQTQAQPQPQQPAQQQPTQQPTQPPQPEDPPDDGPAGAGRMELPDYRKMALEATTAEAFDYAAYMVLRNGLYTGQERIAAVRLAVVKAWKPGPGSNGAMLKALEVYRDKRAEAESRGEASADASKFAKREAMSAYNKEIGS